MAHKRVTSNFWWFLKLIGYIRLHVSRVKQLAPWGEHCCPIIVIATGACADGKVKLFFREVPKLKTFENHCFKLFDNLIVF